MRLRLRASSPSSCLSWHMHMRCTRWCTCGAHAAPKQCVSYRVASQVDHGARPVVCPELSQVPEEHVLRGKVPFIHERLLYAG